MSSHFSRSLRTIDGDGPRRSVILLGFILPLFALWTLWFTTGRIAIYASSSSARLEVGQESHPVEAAVAGRIVSVRAAVGQPVSPGDVLIELDAASERLARSEEEAVLTPTASQVSLLKDELAAEEAALQGEQRAALESVAQAEAESRRARASAELAAEESRRFSNLHAQKLLSDLEALRAKKQAEERASEAEAAEMVPRRIARDAEAREQDRRVNIARLKRQIATIEATLNQAIAATNRLGYEIEKRVIRAQIGGTVADVAPLKIGSVVTEGTRIVTIVPRGDLKVVALFKPSVALGRVRAGQPAHVRLDGFPWTQYGAPGARVSAVAGELHDGTVRVELALERSLAPTIPLQHGLPAEVDIEVERTSPAALVLRTVGAQTRISAAEPVSRQ
jgi:membrane fusion protein (multidrug efflux system)